MLFRSTSVSLDFIGGRTLTDTTYTSDSLFTSKDEAVRSIYSSLLEALHTLGPFQEEPKKTSIHLVRTVGFAGVHPRKSYLILNLRTASPLENPRITKSEQVSKNRFHNEVKLISPSDIDEELLNWLKEAYALG
jgi:Domain of unknown function (DUF5655)